MGGEKDVGITCFPMRRSGGAGGGSTFRASFSAAKTACAEGGERYSGPVPPFPGKNNPGEETAKACLRKKQGEGSALPQRQAFVMRLAHEKTGKGPLPCFSAPVRPAQG
jgi:hypothetical protein